MEIYDICKHCVYMDLDWVRTVDKTEKRCVKLNRYFKPSETACVHFEDDPAKHYITSFIESQIYFDVKDTGFITLNKVIDLIRLNEEYCDLSDYYDEVGPKIVNKIKSLDDKTKQNQITDINLRLLDIELAIKENGKDIDYQLGIDLYISLIRTLESGLLVNKEFSLINS